MLAELQRRNVIRMAGLYLVVAWLIVQVAATLLPAFEAPASAYRWSPGPSYGGPSGAPLPMPNQDDLPLKVNAKVRHARFGEGHTNRQRNRAAGGEPQAPHAAA